MKINDLIRRSWQVAQDKGWHDRPRSDRVYETLFHTEVSEYAEDIWKVPVERTSNREQEQTS